MTPFRFGDGEKPTPGHRRIEVPAGIESKRELLDFLAQAFPLPDYFGHNWDALEECLLDFAERKETAVELVHRDVPLSRLTADQKTYLRILAKISGSHLIVSFPIADRPTVEKLIPA